MSLRLVFDENFGQPIVRALAKLCSFHEVKPKIAHLLDIFAEAGEKDEAWIPKLAAEKWIVVTADKGARGRSKLPRVCREHSVTHVLLVGQLVHRRQFEKVRAVLVIWPDLLEVPDKPPGSRFKIKLGATHPLLEFVGPPEA